MSYTHETWTVTIHSGDRELSIAGIRSPYGHLRGDHNSKEVLMEHMKDVLAVMIENFYNIPQKDNTK